MVWYATGIQYTWFSINAEKMEDDGLLSIKELKSWADLNHVKNKESSYVVSVWN